MTVPCERKCSSATATTLRLANGDVLVTYKEAARRLGLTVATLKQNLLARGWLRPTPYRQGIRRFLKLDDVERVARKRARVTSIHLLTEAEAADYVGVTVRQLRSHLRAGRLHEAGVGPGLYSLDDVIRLRLWLLGIRDPVRLSEGARQQRVTRKVMRGWTRSGRLQVAAVSRTQAWCSASSLRRLASDWRREQTTYREGIRLGTLVRERKAARRLGVSVDKLLWTAKRGDIALVHFPMIHRTVVRAADIERAIHRQLARRREDYSLPPGLLGSAEAAQLLGIRQDHVLKLASTHRLAVAARGTRRRGRLAAFGFDRQEVLRLKAERERAARLVTGTRVCAILGISPTSAGRGRSGPELTGQSGGSQRFVSGGSREKAV